MTREVAYAEVPVGSVRVLTIKTAGRVIIPCRDLCEKAGIDWSNERRRLQKDPILSKAVVKTTTPFSNGQEISCLPLEYVSGWLFKINLNNVNEDARPGLERIQLECYQALHDYWLEGSAQNPRYGLIAARSQLSRESLARKHLPATLDRLERASHPTTHRIDLALARADCEVLGIEPPTAADYPLAQPGLFDGATQ